LELEKSLLKQLINFLGKKICAVEDKWEADLLSKAVGKHQDLHFCGKGNCAKYNVFFYLKYLIA
jgi:hypothetical protein